MAEWHEYGNGTCLVTHDTVRTAYLVIMLLEKERIPRACVDEVFKAVDDILGFQEVTHTAKDEKNPSFPK